MANVMAAEPNIGQGHQEYSSRSPGTKAAFFGPFGDLRAVYVW